MKSALFCAALIAWIGIRVEGQTVSGAVDIKGVHHSVTQYPRGKAPWIQDQLKMVAAEYPLAERFYHHQGSGMFRVMLDAQLGTAKDVVVIKSTGFKALDSSAIACLLKWRWRPQRWRSIDYAFTFTFSRPPPGLRRLPPA